MVTVRSFESVFVSLVAVMVVVPADTPVITPVLELMVATPVFELDHVITRPVKVLFAASFNTAVACDD